MLLQPTLTLTIPSIHDNTVLDCRIYAPKNLSAALKSHTTQWRKKAAIVAHPYALLGGCSDDPVVCAVTSQLLDDGFFVGTFNFRGAGTSKGRSSWSGKPEIQDYASFAGFILHFMHDLSLPQQFYRRRNSDQHEGEQPDLSPIPSNTVPSQHISTSSQNTERPLTLHIGVSSSGFGRNRKEDSKTKSSISSEPTPLLLLAGYSYGALIVRRLPSLANFIPLFIAPIPGTAASEIRLRAQQLARQQNDLFKCRAASLEEKAAKGVNGGSPNQRRAHSLQNNVPMESRKVSGTSSLRIGGEETDPELRRVSHDSQRRSFSFEPERLRKSIDRFRSLGSHPNDHAKSTFHFRKGSVPLTDDASGSRDSSLEVDLPAASVPQPGNGNEDPRNGLGDVKVSYLLISPPQGLVAKLLTMWTFTSQPASKEELLSESERKFVQHYTMAIFGNEDDFSSSTKFYTWAESLRKEEDSKFHSREIDGAGHFWREEGVLVELRRNVKEFVNGL